MNLGVYFKLAFNAIRKNKILYIPYMIACIGMYVIMYSMNYLGLSDALNYIIGAVTIKTVLSLGKIVIGIFTLFFLLYSNSFLLKARKKELGLYNVLGLSKKNIYLVIFFENLILYLVTIVFGTLLGIGFSKLAELGLFNTIHQEISFKYTFSLYPFTYSIIIFTIIFLIIYLYSIYQIYKLNVVKLLNSQREGEKPPKSNLLLGILGIVILGTAYSLVFTIKDPVTSLYTFFGLVILVIIGTYMVMISGSVLILSLLKKNKNYYYKPRNFTTISSLLFRMKRNGAGLASICILSTMVLVTLSFTISLYIGIENSLYTRYPREMDVTFYFNSVEWLDQNFCNSLINELDEISLDSNVIPENTIETRRTRSSGKLEGNTFICNYEGLDFDTLSYLTSDNYYTFDVVPLEDYNRIENANYFLENNQILVYSSQLVDFNILNIEGVGQFEIAEVLDESVIYEFTDLVQSFVVVTPDFMNMSIALSDYTSQFTDTVFVPQLLYDFDTGLPTSEQEEFGNTFLDKLYADYGENDNFQIGAESRELNRLDYYSLLGSVFYIGIILSFIFFLATVLIIYFKQLSEGIEDQHQFVIMKKVGLTKREIRKSVNKQILLVFSLPLIFSAINLGFAYPVTSKMIQLFGLTNMKLFTMSTVITFIIFAIIYVIVYFITSNTYFNLVNRNEESVHF